MKFWDTSAVVPLLLEEPGRERALSLLRADPVVWVWWGTPIEAVSAVARHEREGLLGVSGVSEALKRLHALSDSWRELEPSQRLRSIAQRLLRVHPLRASDSCQLAAAIMAADGQPDSLEFVCLDQRLKEAARREGFEVLD